MKPEFTFYVRPMEDEDGSVSNQIEIVWSGDSFPGINQHDILYRATSGTVFRSCDLFSVFETDGVKRICIGNESESGHDDFDIMEEYYTLADIMRDFAEFKEFVKSYEYKVTNEEMFW